MLANTLTHKPIVVDSDSRLEDRDDDLDNTHTLRTLDSEQLRHVALDLDISSSTFKRSVNKIEDGDNDNGKNGINSNVSPLGVKRQNPASPCCEPNLRHISTPIPSHNEGVE
jgi:hypothetical protein